MLLNPVTVMNFASLSSFLQSPGRLQVTGCGRQPHGAANSCQQLLQGKRQFWLWVSPRWMSPGGAPHYVQRSFLLQRWEEVIRAWGSHEVMSMEQGDRSGSSDTRPFPAIWGDIHCITTCHPFPWQTQHRLRCLPVKWDKQPVKHELIARE